MANFKLPRFPRISDIMPDNPMNAVVTDLRSLVQQARDDISDVASSIRVPDDDIDSSEDEDVKPIAEEPEALTPIEHPSEPPAYKRPLSDSQCMSCLAHNHYLTARGRIKEVIKFYEREGGFTETVISKMHDTMEDLLVPNRDDYAATSENPLVRTMLHDMQNRGDAIKKELEDIVLNPESHNLDDLNKVKDEIVEIQKAAWRLTSIDKQVKASESTT